MKLALPFKSLWSIRKKKEYLFAQNTVNCNIVKYYFLFSIVFYLNILYNVIYSYDCKAEFLFVDDLLLNKRKSTDHSVYKIFIMNYDTVD